MLIIYLIQVNMFLVKRLLNQFRVKPRRIFLATSLVGSVVAFHDYRAITTGNPSQTWLAKIVIDNFTTKQMWIDCAYNYNTYDPFMDLLEEHPGFIFYLPDEFNTSDFFLDLLKGRPSFIFNLPDEFNTFDFLVEYYNRYPDRMKCIKWKTSSTYPYDRKIISQEIMIPSEFQTHELYAACIEKNPCVIRYAPLDMLTVELALKILNDNTIDPGTCEYIFRNINHLIEPDEFIRKIPQSFLTMHNVHNLLTNITIRGDTFNECFGHLEFVKLLNFEENHNGYQFGTGENIDTKPFDPSISCNNGIYFTLVPERWSYIYDCEYDWRPCHLRKVTIPNNATVTFEKNKTKTNIIILGERTPFKSYNYPERTKRFI
jgi:hypothetical protein